VAECAELSVDLHWFSLSFSQIHESVKFTVLSIRPKEAFEFGYFLFLDLFVYYKCMLKNKSPGHMCDNIL